MTVAASRVTDAIEDLQRRALAATEMSVCIVDAQRRDEPLVWVNAAFERVTGYRREDILGVNCRFLQGSHPDRAAAGRIRAGLVEQRTVEETLLNFRADGSPFWNHVVISPLFDLAGELSHFVGVQADVSLEVGVQRERAAALEQTRRAHGRLRSLASVSAQLSTHLDLGNDIVAVLPQIVASQFGGWVAAAGLDETESVTRVAAACGDPQQSPHRVAEFLTDPQNTLLDRMRSRPPGTVLLSEAAEPDGLIVATTLLSLRGRNIGVLAVGREGGFDDEDLADVADLGLRAAVALDNGRLYAREHAAAVTLQRSLLPQLPLVTGFGLAASYQPAESGAEVGGDWYDVLDLPGPGIGIAIGDVIGHDITAAAAMGQLRSVLRSYAWAGDRPAEVVHRLDELVRGLGMAAMATCLYATVTPTGQPGHHTLTYTSAGHPPAVLRHADGSVELLDRALTSPVGVAVGSAAIPEASVPFGPGDHLVLYTDGLIETRDGDITEAMSELAAVVALIPPSAGAQEMCDELVARDLRHGRATEDDTCVLVVHCLAPPGPGQSKR